MNETKTTESSRTTRWLDEANCDLYRLGEVGFLLEICPQEKAARWVLRERAGRTNQSNRDLLNGSLGETNNVSTWARGLARVIKVNANGRLLVEVLEDAEQIAEALEELGYPELAP